MRLPNPAKFVIVLSVIIVVYKCRQGPLYETIANEMGKCYSMLCNLCPKRKKDQDEEINDDSCPYSPSQLSYTIERETQQYSPRRRICSKPDALSRQDNDSNQPLIPNFTDQTAPKDCSILNSYTDSARNECRDSVTPVVVQSQKENYSIHEELVPNIYVDNNIYNKNKIDYSKRDENVAAPNASLHDANRKREVDKLYRDEQEDEHNSKRTKPNPIPVIAEKVEDDINILLIGETGVGKSTFVNAYSNYILRKTFQEALKKDPLVQIPVYFTLTNDDFEDVEYKYGEDPNENYDNFGESVTQSPKSHIFYVNKRKICIIDTPGMGDTRGVDQDEINMKNIHSYLKQFTHINAVCILLRPNASKLTPSLEYSLKSLLRSYKKIMQSNVVFVFTNCRTTLYRPGETYPVLKTFLQNLQKQENILVPLTKDNVFCVDNETFRFLIAVKQGFQVPEYIYDNYCDSWDRTSVEYKRILDYITNLKPYRNKYELNNDITDIMADIIIELVLTISSSIVRYKKEYHCLKRSCQNKSCRLDTIQLDSYTCSYCNCSIFYHGVDQEDFYAYKKELKRFLRTAAMITVLMPTLENKVEEKLKQKIRREARKLPNEDLEAIMKIGWCKNALNLYEKLCDSTGTKSKVTTEMVQEEILSLTCLEKYGPHFADKLKNCRNIL